MKIPSIVRYLMLGIAALLMALPSATLSHAGGYTFDKIHSSGRFLVGYREASIPFSYLGNNQRPVGLSIDLCAAIADEIKASLQLKSLDVSYVAVTGSNRIPLLQNGTIDIECGSTTNNIERRKQVSFSIPIFVTSPRWLVMASSSIATPTDLNSKPVLVTQGSADLGMAVKIIAEEKLEARIVQPKDHAESILMLRTGRGSAWFDDDIVLAGNVAMSPDPKAYRFLPETYELAYYGLMIRKDDQDLKTLVDRVVSEMMKSGKFNELYTRWFERPIEPHGQNLSLPMSAAMKAQLFAPGDISE